MVLDTSAINGLVLLCNISMLIQSTIVKDNAHPTNIAVRYPLCFKKASMSTPKMSYSCTVCLYP